MQIKNLAGDALGGNRPNNPDQQGAQGQGNQFMQMAQGALGGSQQVQQLYAHALLLHNSDKHIGSLSLSDKGETQVGLTIEGDCHMLRLEAITEALIGRLWASWPRATRELLSNPMANLHSKNSRTCVPFCIDTICNAPTVMSCSQTLPALPHDVHDAHVATAVL